MAALRSSRTLASVLALLLAVGALVSLLAVPAGAVTATTIRGVVRDAGRHPIAGADVFAFKSTKYPDVSAHAKTDASGAYTLTLASAAASYKVAAGVYGPGWTSSAYFGAFYGGTGAATAKDIAVAAGSSISGIDLRLSPKPFRRLTIDTSKLVAPKHASRLLRKAEVRVCGDRVLYSDANEVILNDLTSGTPSESVLTSFSGPMDLGSTFAFVGPMRVDLASRAQTRVIDTSWVAGVSCDDTYVAYMTEVESETGVSTYLELYRVGDKSLVRKIKLPGGGTGSLRPGAVSNGRVVVVSGDGHAVVYDIATGAVVRDVAIPDPQVINVGDYDAVLAGDRLVWTDSVHAYAATLTASPATRTIEDVTATTNRLIGHLSAAGNRVSFGEWTFIPGVGGGDPSYSDVDIKVVDLAGGSSFTPFSRAATSSAAPDDINDVGVSRVAWLDGLQNGWGLFDGPGPVAADEVWQSTNAGPAGRIDTTRYADGDQIAPAVSAGRIAWMDDSGSPADATTYDLMLRDTGPSLPTTVDTGLDQFGPGGLALSSEVLAYGKGSQTADSAELWAYDIQGHTKKRLSRSLDQLVGAYGPWVVYTASAGDGVDLLAANVRTGEAVTVYHSVNWDLMPGGVDKGAVLFADDAGAAWSFDLATGVKRAVPPLVRKLLSGEDPVAIDRPHYASIGGSGGYGGGFDSEPAIFGVPTLANADTGEIFATDPFEMLIEGPLCLSGRFLVDSDQLFDITSGDYYRLPVGRGWVEGAALDGDVAAIQMFDPATNASSIHVLDLSPIASPTVRIAGANRVETGVQLSREMTSAPAVVIATARNFPDALAGVPLAHAVGGPILLTEPGALSSTVASEVARLGATKAYVLGSPNAVATSVDASLTSLGLTVQRLQGANRYATAQAIAVELRAVLGHTLPTAFIATGRNFPDALAASAVAARMGAPILLTEPGYVPQPTKDALRSVGATGVVVLGSDKVIADGAVALLPVSGGVRLGGFDRYDTCRLIAEYGADHGLLDAHSFVFAIGNDFPDALGAGAFAAGEGVPLLLVNRATPSFVPKPVADLVRTQKASVTEPAAIVGGEAALPLQLQERISQTLR